MKEKIYTIPVNDAFDSDMECPVCYIYHKLENEAVEYSMGPSYMEDDIRAKTDELGFCEKHIRQVYECENRLGFAWVMKTHLDRMINDIEKNTQQPVRGKTLFNKITSVPTADYAAKVHDTCFICDRVKNTFDRYLDTILHLYKQDKDFAEKYKKCKGFCTTHYGMLIKEASEKMSGSTLDLFVEDTNKLYLDNMKRVRDDVAWFINKFDHKYANEPWKNAKDSLPRAMIKASSYIPEEPKKGRK